MVVVEASDPTAVVTQKEIVAGRSQRSGSL